MIAAGSRVMAVIKADGYNHGAYEVATIALANGATDLGVATLNEALALRHAGITEPLLAWIWDATDPQLLQQAIDADVAIAISSLAQLETLLAITPETAAAVAADDLDAAGSVGDAGADGDFEVTSGSAHDRDSGSASADELSSSSDDEAGDDSELSFDELMAEHGELTAAPIKAPNVWIKVDTGLSRSGVERSAWVELGQRIAAAQHRGQLNLRGAMTHMACADEPDHPANNAQRDAFFAALETFAAQGAPCEINHICNSPATLSRPDLHLQAVRPGVALYGMEPISGRTHDLRPAMTLTAPVTVVKTVAAGDRISYGGTWEASADTRLAVVACGYADGLPRSASGNFDVEIAGFRVPQRGRVCMDQFVVDLGAPDSPAAQAVQPGDIATIFGAPSECRTNDGRVTQVPTATELAENAGTIDYEILTNPHGARITREYVGRGIQDGSAQVATAEATRQLGQALGRLVRAGDVVILDGPLGAGKTTFTQGFARGMGVRGRVTSPTFTIARVHEPAGDSDNPALIHVDAYRLLDSPDSAGDPLGALDSLDLESELDRSVIVAEWGAGLVDALSRDYLLIEIDRSLADAAGMTAVPGAPGASGASGNAADTADTSGNDNGAQISGLSADSEPRLVRWSWHHRGA